MAIMESTEYLDNFTPASDLEEPVCFPLKCCQNVCLSDIWIPTHLLEKNKSPNSEQAYQGIFHILEKEGSTKQINSFSVYIDSNEDEIFQSDSDEEILFSSKSNNCGESKNFIQQSLENTSIHDKMLFEQNDYNENAEFCNILENIVVNKDELLKSSEAVETILMNDLSTQTVAVAYDSEKNIFTKNKNDVEILKNTSDGEISLHEILDKTPVINIKKFSFDYIKKDNVQGNNTIEKKKERISKRNSKKIRQLKKKASKIISLNELTANESDEDRCCNEFFNHIMSQKGLDLNHGLSLKNKIEFPELGTEKMKLIKSDNSASEKFENGLISAVSIHSSQAENKQSVRVCKEMPLQNDDNIFGKLVIENIPLDVSKEDINNILMGYGKIKSFSLKPDGKFLKAYVVMNLISDIDWIVECLNGSDLFGASSEMLKCYVTESCG